jgi:hypothetical protein
MSRQLLGPARLARIHVAFGLTLDQRVEAVVVGLSCWMEGTDDREDGVPWP